MGNAGVTHLRQVGNVVGLSVTNTIILSPKQYKTRLPYQAEGSKLELQTQVSKIFSCPCGGGASAPPNLTSVKSGSNPAVRLSRIPAGNCPNILKHLISLSHADRHKQQPRPGPSKEQFQQHLSRLRPRGEDWRLRSSWTCCTRNDQNSSCRRKPLWGRCSSRLGTFFAAVLPVPVVFGLWRV